MLKQKLQQKLLQKLSPQQIQLIKLLEIPTYLLDQRIKKEMEENPALEEGRVEETEYGDEDESQGEETEVNVENTNEEISIDDYYEDDDIPDYRLQANNHSKDDRKTELPYSVGSTFHEFMHEQLVMRNLTKQEKTIAEYIIGNIDDDGYLRRDVESIVDDMALTAGIVVKDKELADVLKIVQTFDPAGVGATTLQECLILQLDRKLSASPKNSGLIIAKKLLKDYFEEFSKKHFDKIQSRLNLSQSQLKLAVDEVIKLNPKPGSAYSQTVSRSEQVIIPDFILENHDGQLVLSLNSQNVPDLHVSRTYHTMLENYASKNTHSHTEKEAITFVKQKLDSAKWFIDAIKQRINTLQTTMQSIIEYQHDYFLTGDEIKLKPMILKDIAERTGLDISTISRVANSKHIQTNFGIYPLKYFFSEGMQTDTGEEVSTREIKRILKQHIESESKKRPLTDERLAEILKEEGYLIARRTVAKYREQLGILVARLRKEV